MKPEAAIPALLRLLRGATLWLLVASSAPLLAQTGYLEPGELLDERTDDAAELEAALRDARWQLGGVRLDPSIGLRQLSWVDNTFGDDTDQTRDLTATVGAGLRILVPAGAKVVTILSILPEYVWWADLEERRRLNGRYGGRLYGDFSRARFSAILERRDSQGVISPEIEQLLSQRTDEAGFEFGVELYRSLELFAEFAGLEIESLLDSQDPAAESLQALDRSEDSYLLGVQSRLGRYWRAGLGLQRLDVDFVGKFAARSNRGSGPFVRLELDAPRARGEILVADRDLEPQPGSSVVPHGELTGRFGLDFPFANGRRSLGFYGEKDLLYSISESEDYFLHERLGVGFSSALGERMNGRIFFEDGELAFFGSRDGSSAQRIDERQAFGLQLRYQLPWGLQVGARWTERKFRVQEADEVNVSEIGLAINLAALEWP